VLGNLISNAVKYGDKGTEIKVRVVQHDCEVEIDVENHGAGIPAQEIPLLFNRFTRSKKARRSGKPGLGVGLYIAKALIEAHGGRIWVDSTPGVTTTFHVALPARRPEQLVACALSARRRAVGARTRAVGPKSNGSARRVAASQANRSMLISSDVPTKPKSSAEKWVGIVDDDRSIRRALARALVSNGMVARAFSSAEDYLAREPHENPCCLVLDVRLGGLSGIELHDRLDAEGSAPPTIFITAMEEMPATQLLGRAGPSGFLRKPFATEELVGMVRKQCTGSSDDPTG